MGIHRNQPQCTAAIQFAIMANKQQRRRWPNQVCVRGSLMPERRKVLLTLITSLQRGRKRKTRPKPSEKSNSETLKFIILVPQVILLPQVTEFTGP